MQRSKKIVFVSFSTIALKSTYSVRVYNSQIYLTLVSSICNFVSIGSLDIDSIKERKALNFHSPKLLQSKSEYTGKTMNPLGYGFKPFRSVIYCIHSSHVCK